MAVPTSTYRLQIDADFDLHRATELLDYLDALGAGAVYLSPLLQSVRGSKHGYDVVDHSRVDADRGGPEALAVLVEAAHGRGLGVVIDIVPNHMGVADPAQNTAWRDVQEHGQDSPYARWFDIDQNTGRYRRFFAVDDLAGLRVEDPEVFEATHREIARWLRELHIDGLRVDHPDGLADPADYLRRLRELAPGAWLVVEKITESGETMPGWPVDGLTGYDALTELTNVFVDPAGEAAFDALQRELTGDERPWSTYAADGKRMVATTMLRPEADRIAALGRRTPEEIVDYAVGMPVYRDYGAADETDIRLQQLSGAVMAKGVEDTAYYRYTRLSSLTEVGGDPGRFGAPLADFHGAMQHRQEHAPHGMTTLSTHDTKRGEDVRAMIDVLAEIPDEWAAAVRELHRLAPVPNPALAPLLWQTFVGTSRPEPIARERMHAYLEKAMREAADGTSWSDPDPVFETAVHAAIDAGYDNAAARSILTALVDQVLPFGYSNALSQKLVQLTMPGIPDVYQGTELWEDSLVDPDNRRPIDFELRRQSLVADEHPKLRVVARALWLRRDRPDLFTRYAALSADGIAVDHLIAFDRGGAITLATRLPARLARDGGWRDTTIALNGTDLLTGRSFNGSTLVADVLADYPGALIVDR